MTRVSIDSLRQGLSEARRTHDLFGTPRSAWMVSVLEDYLAYREGFDPAERLPEDIALENYRVVHKDGRVLFGLYGVDDFYGEDGWEGFWSWKLEDVARWYPLPWGGRDGD